MIGKPYLWYVAVAAVAANASFVVALVLLVGLLLAHVTVLAWLVNRNQHRHRH